MARLGDGNKTTVRAGLRPAPTFWSKKEPVPFKGTGSLRISSSKKCYNLLMNKSDAKAYIKRWQEVERIEREEARTASIQERWKKLNALFGLALELDLFSKQRDPQEEVVWQRWAKLRKMGEV